MTKYIVGSGGTRNYPDRGRELFAEIVKDQGPTPRILVCCFAQPREDWEEGFEADKQDRFKLFPVNVRPVYELAFPDTFEEQIGRNDIIYIHGGDDHLVQYWLSKFDLPKIWDGKVVATSSASSNALSKCFWTCDWRQCMDGLGVLPIKFLPHYKSTYGQNDPRGPVDWEKGYQELTAYGDQILPIHALEEGMYAVIGQ